MAMALRTAYAVALSLVASSASAEQFSWQLSGSYGETELSSFADAERTMLEAEDRLAQSETQTATALLSMYKALGGGFRPLDRATAAR